MRSGSEPLEAVDLGEVVEQPLHVRRHGRGLGHVGAGRVEPGLVSVVLHLRLELSTTFANLTVPGRRRPILGPSPSTTKNLSRH